VLPGPKAHFLRLTQLNGWLVWLCTEAEKQMKSKGGKRGGLWVGCCREESDFFFFLGLWEEGFGDHNGKFSIIWLLLSFSKVTLQRKEEKQNTHQLTHECDFVNIFGNKTLNQMKWTQMLCF